MLDLLNSIARVGWNLSDGHTRIVVRKLAARRAAGIGATRMPQKIINKPKSLPEYQIWMKSELSLDLSSAKRAHYDTVLMKVRDQFCSSDLWRRIVDDLRREESAYYARTGYHLLANSEPPTFLLKQFEPFLLKTFRKNVIENANFPDEPRGGWITPGNWFTRVSDAVRTMIVVKYLDGVEIVLNSIRRTCKELSAGFTSAVEARDEGYYAAHAYIEFPCTIINMAWENEDISAKVEIQVTTQLKEVIKNLTHVYYEERRMDSSGKKSRKWQWDYESDQFVAGYLGHILHYVEGMIMDIRKRQLVQRSESQASNEGAGNG